MSNQTQNELVITRKRKPRKYPEKLKRKYVALMLTGVSANELSKETEISQTTLSKWLREAEVEKQLQASMKRSRKSVQMEGQANSVVVLARIAVPRDMLLRAALESNSPVIDLSRVLATGTDA